MVDTAKTAPVLSPVPTWPITDREAAARLFMSVYRLRRLARRAGCGRIAGARILLWEADIKLIIDALPAAGRAPRSGSAVSRQRARENRQEFESALRLVRESLDRKRAARRRASP